MEAINLSFSSLSLSLFLCFSFSCFLLQSACFLFAWADHQLASVVILADSQVQHVTVVIKRARDLGCDDVSNIARMRTSRQVRARARERERERRGRLRAVSKQRLLCCLSPSFAKARVKEVGGKTSEVLKWEVECNINVLSNALVVVRALTPQFLQSRAK